ncbi:hypothetical protein [Janthinobacterium violaceinigrum]|uniref:Uncharacterized protein n=1 Tax=Janthinobacterium violaceinigrum TaxID=2654252 RepID=A0A6I1IEW1_9BURK|nr:hypothetical protein [Janthinobacterium violaceinigrum]KAB8066836.1 hypothetical protein GCN75_00785 [Janthinobacterium violaceinigrum]
MKTRSVIFFAIVIGIMSPSFARTCKTANCGSDNIEHFMASDGASLVRTIQRKLPGVLHMPSDGKVPAYTTVEINSPASDTALSMALARAWKRSWIEKGVDNAKGALLACQRETSLLLTVPFMRSEGQQAHCYRF